MRVLRVQDIGYRVYGEIQATTEGKDLALAFFNPNDYDDDPDMKEEDAEFIIDYGRARVQIRPTEVKYVTAITCRTADDMLDFDAHVEFLRWEGEGLKEFSKETHPELHQMLEEAFKEVSYERAFQAKKWLQFLKYNVSDDSGSFSGCIDPEEMADGIFSIREDGKIRWMSGEQLIDFAKSKGWEG